SYDPDFEAARMEADKSTENDFAVMEEASRRFLSKKSKDMRALGYLAFSSAMNNGLDAFAEAVQAYCRLVMEHWDDIHPKRPAARANALKWLNGERVIALLGGVDGGANYEALLAAQESLSALSRFVDGKFPQAPPSFGGFVKVVRDFTQKHKPSEKAPETAAAEPVAAAAGGGGAPAAIASGDDAFIAIQNAAYFLMEADKADPLPYRLVRMLKWEPLRETIPNQGGRTMVPPPYSATLDAFRNLFQNAQWHDLAKNGEEAFSADGMIFWFDLQRYLCSALAGMGPEFAPCAQAIRMELALLLSRLPALAGFTFDDGTPFADPITREWIQGEVLGSLGGTGGEPAPVKKKGDVGEEQAQAAALLGEGKLEPALQVLRTGLANDSNEKNNFDRKMIMAELCFKGGKPHIARSILEDLLETIAKYSLLHWDPGLCVSVYHLSQKVFLAMMAEADESMKARFWEKALEMHTQISRLDQVLAISADIK